MTAASEEARVVTKVDVAIVGGGLVGASLALALEGTGLRTLLVETVAPESATQPSFDDRTTALGNASRRIFESIGVWDQIAPEAAAIETIHVSEAGRFGFARLRASQQGVDAFGYVVPNRIIGAALWERLRRARDVCLRLPAQPRDIVIHADRVELGIACAIAGDASSMPATGAMPPADSETVVAGLVVAADGAKSIVRAAAGIEASVEDYDQVAVVANVGADRPHDGTAFERFTPTGPVAVLPLRDGGHGVIWTCAPDRAAEVLALDDTSFLRELQQRFGWRLGRFTRAGKRGSYPLRLTRATSTIGTRTVLIGNAAQALHPVAGQGFNLGLRDAAMLAEVLVAERDGAVGTARDVGSPELLQKFARWRSGDRSGVLHFTDGLVKLFADARPGVGLLRNLGLLLFDVMPPAKQALARVSYGFSGPTPRLARGIRLSEPVA